MPASSARAILIAEDEEAVKMLAVLALKTKGYTPIAASTADEALDLWRNHKEDIALLFTDLSMPGMSGLDLATHLRSAQPTLPIIFTSGDVEEASHYGPTLQQGVKHLLKPYRPSDLLATIASMLPPAAAAA